MNAVIGMSRILMESDLPPDLYECAETIESSGNYDYKIKYRHDFRTHPTIL
jgi:hypothetical protein